jgi:alkylresorcinol/alkylpyrone synthase
MKSFIIAARTVFPEHRYIQGEAIGMLKDVWPRYEGVLDRLAKTSMVESRNFLLPLQDYKNLKTMGERNDLYITGAKKLLGDALRRLADECPFPWEDVAIMTSTTITGIAVPSLDARLMNDFPIPRDVLRNPLFGLGCLGGVAALNRTHTFLQSYPDKLALVFAVEACSLTFQFDDVSMANMVGSSLFADGSGVVLMAGEKHPLAKKARLRMTDHQSSFYPQTERIMGWDVVDSGFRIVLSGDVPQIVHDYVGNDVQHFLGKSKLALSDINNIISHPGGPKVLHALAEVLQKDEHFLRHSWNSLREQGNMSSVSVLNVLERSLKDETLRSGPTLALAMGPAFNSEVSLMHVE